MGWDGRSNQSLEESSWLDGGSRLKSWAWLGGSIGWEHRGAFYRRIRKWLPKADPDEKTQSYGFKTFIVVAEGG